MQINLSMYKTKNTHCFIMYNFLLLCDYEEKSKQNYKEAITRFHRSRKTGMLKTLMSHERK